MARRRREVVARHFVVEGVLGAEALEAYRGVLREPRTTVDLAHGWLRERGAAVSRSAVARHRRWFLEREARREESVALAVRLREVAAGGGAEGKAGELAAASALRIEQIVFERLMKEQEAGGMSTAELADYARLLRASARMRVELAKGSGESRGEDRGSRVEDGGSRGEDRGSRVEDGGSRGQDRGVRGEDRGSREEELRRKVGRMLGME